jgi:hypothetical protein
VKKFRDATTRADVALCQHVRMNAPRGIPLRADPGGIRDLSMRSLSRAAIAIATRAFSDGSLPGPGSASDVLKERNWDNDRVGAIITRAASSPAMTTNAQWAGELATVATAFLQTLVPMSAAAQLLSQCLRVSFDRRVSIKLPAINPGTASWIGEGQPIRVVDVITAAGPTLSPFKLASIVTLTREMMDSSEAEQIVRQALIDSTAPALDASLFSAAAADTTRPAGILVGATSVTPSTSTSKLEVISPR